MGREAWRATVHEVTKESDLTYRLNNNIFIFILLYLFTITNKYIYYIYKYLCELFLIF